MEKLIKSLNEYRKEKGERSLNEFEVSQTLDSLNYLKLFIKWLIENNKITDGTCMLQIIISDLEKYECVLMQLAISDTPLNDLIKLLN